MTVAICLKCGAEKFGALTPCRQCDFLPMDVVDRAQSTVLSDHYMEVNDLRQLGKRISAGEAPELPQEEVNNYIQLYENELLGREEFSGKTGWLSGIFGCMGAILLPVGFVVLMVLGFTVAGKYIGRPAPSPLSSGTVSQLELKGDDGKPLIGSKASVYYDYVKVKLRNGNSRWIPRDQIKHLDLFK